MINVLMTNVLMTNVPMTNVQRSSPHGDRVPVAPDRNSWFKVFG